MDDTSCPSENPETYGLGIRLGFYLQWLAGAFAAVLRVKADVGPIRFGLLAFTIATLIAVIVQTSTSDIPMIDIYVPMLLCFGYFYMFIPISAWRIISCCDPTLDPTKWTLVIASAEFDITQQSLLLAVSGFKLWFWTTKVSSAKNPECPEFGFLFCRVNLNALVLRAINIDLDGWMTCFCIVRLVAAISWFLEGKLWVIIPIGGITGIPGAAPQGLGQIPVDKLRYLVWVGAFRLFTSVVVIAATELTIQWNPHRGMYALKSASQLIPLMLGAMVLTHTIYRSIRPAEYPLAHTRRQGEEMHLYTWRDQRAPGVQDWYLDNAARVFKDFMP